MMKLIILMCLMITFAQQGQAQQPRDLPETPIGIQTTFRESAAQAMDSLIQNLINQTNLDTLIHFVNILSGEDSVVINGSAYLFLSRNVFHPHNNLAADFIFQTLTRFGLPTYDQKYSAVGRNVYAVQTGTAYPEQKFIICAHYDDKPVQPPAPGADDNASGTAAVLEAARILSQIQTPYTIIFALWDDEESGGFGSTYYAQQASKAGEKILGVINLDMLGWDGNNDGLFEIHANSMAPSMDLANLVKNLNTNYQVGLAPRIYNPGAMGSDHVSFWKAGYTAVFLIEAYWGGDFNPYYHTSNDRIEKFNLAYFHALSKLAVATISYLSLNNIPTAIVSEEPVSPSDFVLHQNYPNPFSSGARSPALGGGNPSTTIEFALPKASLVTLKIYDLLGNEVTTLVAEKLPAGKHQRGWEAKGLASGVYLYRLEAGDPSTGSGRRFVQTRKLVLLR